LIDEYQYTDEERRALIRQHMWQAAPQRLKILRTQFNQPTGRSKPSRLLPRARPDSSFAVSSHDAMRVWIRWKTYNVVRCSLKSVDSLEDGDEMKLRR